MLVYAFAKSKRRRKTLVEDAKTFVPCGKYKSMKADKDSVIFSLEGAAVKIYILTDTMFKVVMLKDGEEEYYSPAVYKRSWDGAHFDVTEDDSYVYIKTSGINIAVKKSNMNISFEDSKGVVNSDYDDLGMGFIGDGAACYKAADPEEHFYGFGEKTGPLDKRNWDTVNWNTDTPAKHDDSTKCLYQSMPFLIGLRGGRAYGIFFDNTYRTYFNMVKENPGYYSFRSEGGNLTYYFMYGPDIRDVVEKYTDLTGRMSMPPLWALGFQQCRWSYYPERRVMEIARTFREKSIPCDTIYLDIDYMDGYRVFTHDGERFPDFKGMIDKLHKMGFKVVTIIDPGVKVDKGYDVYKEGIEKGYFTKNKDGRAFVGRVWPMDSCFPDFSRKEVRSWWGGLNTRLLKDGVDGIWNDMNEPSEFVSETKTLPEDLIHENDGNPVTHAAFHNLYGMMMDEGTLQGCLGYRKNTRPFLLTRSGFCGIQRISAVWTGDNMSLWEHLRLSIPMNCNLGLSGVSFIGNDVGGFGGNGNEELLTRWTEVGVFLPLFRNHSAIKTRDQEPWAFGNKTENNCRKYIKMRYALLPHLYNLMREACINGSPVIRPLVYEFQGDEKVYAMDDEFMFGDSILVAPVMESGRTKRDVYLPGGKWADFWTGETIEGGRSITAKAPIDVIPVYVKCGSIIPMWNPQNYVGEKENTALSLYIYPDDVCKYNYYEDDGETFDYKGGKYSITTFRFEKRTGGYELRTEKIHDGFKSSIREYVLNIVCSTEPLSVRLCSENGEEDVNFKVKDGRLVIKLAADGFSKLKINF